MGNLAKLISTGRRIRKEEGWWPMLVRGSRYAVARVFQVGRFDLYVHPVDQGDFAKFQPKVENFTVKIIHSNEEADEFPPGWDPRPIILSARQRLKLGTPGFFIYVGDELAHTAWVALTAEAKKCVDNIPYRVDFEHGEVCGGGTWTRPKFRGLGLMTYSYCLRFKYLRERGYKLVRSAVAVGNVASHKAHVKFAHRKCARGLYVRCGPWTYWRERPTPS